MARKAQISKEKLQSITDYLLMCGSHREALRSWDALLVTRLVIYLEFKAHITSMATTAFCRKYTIPSGLPLVGLSFVFQLDNDPTQLHAV
jgi:hypothetical protein